MFNMELLLWKRTLALISGGDRGAKRLKLMIINLLHTKKFNNDF